jgi:hypothetical protein
MTHIRSKLLSTKIIVAFITVLFSAVVSSKTCTDDYIISGGRSIALLPDNPFQIFEKDSELIVVRGTLVFKFYNPVIVNHNGNLVKRYELIFIDEKYFFDMTNSLNEKFKWEQYANSQGKRGFGGTCW